MTVQVHFLPDDIYIEAEAGEPILTVAAQAGVIISTGCLMGSCHACEVELNDNSLCACISSIPRGQPEITINLYSDPVW